MISKPLHLYIQQYLAIQVKAAPFQQAVNLFFISSDIDFGTAMFAATSGTLVGMYSSFVDRIDMVLRGCTGHIFGSWDYTGHWLKWSWRNCTRLCPSGNWQGWTGYSHGVNLQDRSGHCFRRCCRNCTDLFLAGTDCSILRSIVSSVHQMIFNVAPIHWLFLWHGWWCWQCELVAVIGGWR